MLVTFVRTENALDVVLEGQRPARFQYVQKRQVVDVVVGFIDTFVVLWTMLSSFSVLSSFSTL